jgi:transposase
MVVDGASSHKAKELSVPENIRLLSLPGYSPELNPEEHIWDELREKAFPNAVLARLSYLSGLTLRKCHEMSVFTHTNARGISEAVVYTA